MNIFGINGEGEWSIIFRQNPPIWVVVLVLIPAILGVTYFIYRKEKSPGYVKLLLSLLRGGLIFIILLILAQPVLLVEQIIRKESHLAILIDDSLSMGFKEDGKSRIERVNAVFSNPQSLPVRQAGDILKKLAEQYKLKIYSFSSTLKPLAIDKTLSPITPSGDGTAIGHALIDAVQDLGGQHITGIILVSDGQNNLGIEPIQAIDTLKNRANLCPVYAIAPNPPAQIKDIELLDLKTPSVAIVNDFASFDVTLKSTGFKDGDIVTIQLLEQVTGSSEPPKQVAEQTVKLTALPQAIPVSLQYKPSRTGDYVFTVNIPFQTGEVTEMNNSIAHYVKVVDDTIKVLYVESYPRWEYSRLKNALIRDRTMKASVLLVDSDPDFPQESSPNIPPVYQFPQTRKELFNYDVIILGDVHPQSLGLNTTTLIDNLKLFVDEMGGGIGFIAGPKYNPDGFRGTLLTELLPVTLEDHSYTVISAMNQGDDNITRQSFRPKLTPEGRTNPVMRLENEPERNLRLWENADGLPELVRYYPVKKAKSGAAVLAVHPVQKNKYGERPVFASFYYGHGRTFWSSVDETWRWCRFSGDKYFYAFWGNVIRFLRGGNLAGNKRLLITTDKPRYILGDKVKISARIYDPDFKPLTRSSYPLSLSMNQTETDKLTLAPAAGKEGHYDGSFTPSETGYYQLTIATDSNESIKTTASFMVDFSRREYENIALNIDGLKNIAAVSGGEFLFLDDINKLPGLIKPSADIVHTETKEKDLWDSPFIFVAFLLVICAEWIIRKLVMLL
ncbi:MAG: hypothetical protein HY762_01095 [Planctomycetes bacterium]|nr:hypothetical protein [Planctomycetota bacterium]